MSSSFVQLIGFPQVTKLKAKAIETLRDHMLLNLHYSKLAFSMVCLT